jgi:dCTP deaminase
MCILPDHEILAMMKKGSLRIEGFSEGSLTPNGYDLRISEVSIPSKGELHRQGTAIVPPMTRFFASTVEYVGLPIDVCAQLWLRTSWIRKGIVAGLGKVDAGFEGTLTFSGFNFSDVPIDIDIGTRFVQIVFEKLCSTPSLPYEKRSGNYQGQRGITLEPLSRSGE